MNWSTSLRSTLARNAERYAIENGLQFYKSLGKAPAVLFERSEDGTQHGNFFSPAFDAIRNQPAWERRLQAHHQNARKTLPAGKRDAACELDSCNSSDALLMNVFCDPKAPLRALNMAGSTLAVSTPEFGVAGRVPLLDGTDDRTKIDMKVGDLIVEAKLTEPDFTSKSKEHVERYRDFSDAFHVQSLPRDGEKYRGYQLIRNVLAASHYGWRFLVALDARRPDLLREWWAVHSAIRDSALRQRCGFIFWQELAHLAHPALQRFLFEKYGFQRERIRNVDLTP